MDIIVPAIIGAAVALAAAGLGHWQWQRQRAVAARERYAVARSDALKELWEKLNDHSTASRMARLTPTQFYENVQDLNFFLIRKAPFLTPEEMDLARLYLESVYAFRAMVDTSRNRAAREALLTSRVMDEVGGLMGALGTGQHVQEIEDRLAAHIRDALAGKNDQLDVALLRAELTRPPELVLPEIVLPDDEPEDGQDPLA